MRWIPILLLAVLAAWPANAAVFRVTKTADTLDGACGPDCSLREAVQASNETPEQDAILLGPGVYTLTLAGTQDDLNKTGDLDVHGPLAIFGEGAETTILDGNGTDRVLDVRTPGRLDLQRVTVRNGATPSPSTPFNWNDGGGIRADELTLVESLVTANRSASYGGGISVWGLVIRDSTVSGNEAARGGGGIYALGILRAENVTVSGNRAPEGGGGLLLSGADQELSQVTVTANESTDRGGGIRVTGFDCPSSDPFCQIHLVLSRSIVAGNTGAAGRPDCDAVPENAAGLNVFGVGEGCGQGIQDRAGTLAQPLDPKLSPLDDHGGPTPTHLPLPGSPAIDLGSTVCTGKDQRGAPRPADGDGDGEARCDSGAVEATIACVPTDTALCFENGRFRATAFWKTAGGEGPAHALPVAAGTGYFWFFSPDNLEINIKVLNGCGVNGRFWVFVSGLTNVEVDIFVEDFVKGEVWRHTHPAGAPFAPRLDTSALACVNQ